MAYEEKKSKAYMIEELIMEFGGDEMLEEVRAHYIRRTPYRCPKCKGRGYVKVTYNAYPSGLPDSGFVYEEGIKDVKCDLCDGVGYTAVQYKPKMEQTGWEEVNE